MRFLSSLALPLLVLFLAAACDPAPTTTETNTTATTTAATTKSSPPALDKQIRLELGSPNLETDDTTFLVSAYQTFHLIKFNKANYPGLKSAVFTPSLYISDGTATVTAELFNVTDKVAIAGSRVSSSKKEYVFVDSEDILAALPDKEVTLGIRIKSSKRTKTAKTGAVSYLFLNR